jgi:hypothetical protein
MTQLRWMNVAREIQFNMYLGKYKAEEAISSTDLAARVGKACSELFGWKFSVEEECDRWAFIELAKKEKKYSYAQIMDVHNIVCHNYPAHRFNISWRRITDWIDYDD